MFSTYKQHNQIYLAMKLIFTLLAFTLLAFSANSQVLINEYCAANNSLTDFSGKTPDWVELYNAGGTNIDLTGYYLSDKAGNNLKYAFPSATINSGQRVMMYCSGRNMVSGTEYHTNFKLRQSYNSEKIVLSDATGTIIDSLTIIPCQYGHSRGRQTDGAATWELFTSSTPNASNAGFDPEYTAKPLMDQPAGNYAGSVNVNITSTDATATVHYTADGTTPTTASTVAAGPISITSTTVIKARGFSATPGVPASFLETNTYFIDESHTVKVLSISGDQITDFINDIAPGAFSSNFNGSIEYFDESLVLIEEATGFANKHGNDSWAYAQRGIDFSIEDEYGQNNEIHYQMFREKGSRLNYQKLIIKAAANDNYPLEPGGCHMRDAYVHTLSQKGKLLLDERSYEPCVLYIDGAYWGVYDIREKVDDHDFTDHYYQQGQYDLQFLKTWGPTWAEYDAGGTALADWNTFSAWVAANDMTIPANWNTMKSQYKWQSLVDYVVLNSVIVSADWLNWNTAWWRGMDPLGQKKKYRYTLWDMDASFGHYINYTGVPDTGPTADPCNPEALPDPGGQGHIPILNKLMLNDTFQQYYVSRYIDLFNDVFNCTAMISHLDSLIGIIDPEMDAQFARWGGSRAGWEANVQGWRDWITTRCTALEAGMVNCYNLTGPFDMTYDVQPPGAGDIKVNSLWLPNYIFSGQYYGNIDILLNAQANAGFQFAYWEFGSHVPTPSLDSASVSFQATAPDNIIAHFFPDDSTWTPPATYEGFHVPTAFSPDGNGLHDVLQYFVGYDIERFKMSIYNRWGQLLFETEEAGTYWDGQFKGEIVPSGVYTYILSLEKTDGSQEARGGNITIVK
jgi:gliding motility-associated-like protein